MSRAVIVPIPRLCRRQFILLRAIPLIAFIMFHMASHLPMRIVLCGGRWYEVNAIQSRREREGASLKPWKKAWQLSHIH